MVSPPAFTVRQLLASGVLREALLIGGARGLDTAVSDIVLRTRVDARTPPERGLAVVLDAATIGDNLYQVDVALRAIAGADPEAFIALLADATQAPVCLIGQDRRPVAGASIEIGDRRLAGDDDYLIDHSARAALHSAPIVVAPGEQATYWLVGESLRSGSSQRLLRSLLQLGSWYMAALLGSGRVRAERDARRRIAVLNEIMHAGEVPERDVQSQLVELGWSASG